MPKRTTLTFTSEDAPAVEEGKLFAYHCKYSGRHALTLGAFQAVGERAALPGRCEQARGTLCGVGGLPVLPERPLTCAADVDMKKLPRRRTDGSYVVDTKLHTVKLYTSDGGIKLIKRCVPHLCAVFARCASQ